MVATETPRRTFSELSKLDSFDARYGYLRIAGYVGEATFGFDRYLNQKFYTSREWRRIRDAVIVRDNGCDLGVEGYEIFSRIVIHHMNPLTFDDVARNNLANLDPEFLITTTHDTHNAIHYGKEATLHRAPVVRAPGDTKLW